MMFGGLAYAVTEELPQDKAAYLNMLRGTVIARDMIGHYAVRNETQFKSSRRTALFVAQFLCVRGQDSQHAQKRRCERHRSGNG